MTELIKIIDTIDINPILESYYKLEPYIQWTDYLTTKQTGLQYRNENEPWTDAVGSSTYSSNTNLNKSWYENQK